MTGTSEISPDVSSWPPPSSCCIRWSACPLAETPTRRKVAAPKYHERICVVRSQDQRSPDLLPLHIGDDIPRGSPPIPDASWPYSWATRRGDLVRSRLAAHLGIVPESRPTLNLLAEF